MTYRFVHLSDIHFGQEKEGTLPKHEFIRNALVADVESLAKVRGAATRLLITGDIAYSGKQEQYAKATAWLEKLTKASGCDETHVSSIPGNHDCDVAAISNQAKMIYAQFRLSTPEQVQANLDGIAQDDESANPFLPKLRAYRNFAEGYGCDFESTSRPFWVRNFDFAGGIKLQLYGLSSVQVSDLSDSLGKMILGNKQYMIAEEKNIINVVLVHHPLSWFIDRVEAVQHIYNTARVIMVGHEHMLNLHKTTDGLTKKEWLVVYAGAANPPEKGYSYTYNWIEFECEKAKEQWQLIVRVFPRVWVQEKVRFDADRRRLEGAGDSTTVEILCPNIQFEAIHAESNVDAGARDKNVAASVKPAAKPAAKPADVETVGGRLAATARSGSGMKSESAGFERLRYLFWRYLDWRQRLKVLVDIDALPKTADQPIPQTLERVALDAVAKDSSKLHDLWEAVMALVPEEKRSSNPFSAEGK